MAQYTVRTGDTLLSIAERCYGHGYLWQLLAESNPLARAGVLYEGQRLELPPLSPTPSLADSRRLALPLGHMPVRIKLDGSGPLFRLDGFGAYAITGLIGELTFRRQGTLQLADLSHSRLLGYRLEQLAWARELFVEHFCQAGELLREFVPVSTGPAVVREPVHWSGLGFTIVGRLGQWRVVNLQPNQALRGSDWRARLTLNPAALFHSATLVLEDNPTGPEPAQERFLPLGRVLRSACPEMISPAALWVLTRDRASFPQTQISPYTAIESNGSAEIASGEPSGEQPATGEPVRKKSKRKLLQRSPPTKKRKTRKKP